MIKYKSAILAVVATARLWIAGQQGDFHFEDEGLYFNIGRNLALENRYALNNEFAIRQAPGLPFALGLLGKMTRLTPLKARDLNGLVSATAVAFYGWAAWLMTRRRAAVATVLLLTGFHPAFLYMSVTNYPQAFQAFWLACLVLVWAVRHDRTELSAGWGVGDGALIGLGALFVPTQIFVIPAAAIFHLRQGWRWMSTYLVLLGAGLLLVVGPWIVRNLVVEKQFIPFSTAGGEQFYWGFNDQAGPNTGISIAKIAVPEEMKRELWHAGSGKAAEQVFADHAKVWIRAHPARAAGLWMLKFANFFRLDNGNMVMESERSAGREWVARVTSLGVFGVALLGCWRLRRRAPEWPVATGVLLLALAAGHAFFISRYRYRLPFEPFLVLVGVLGWFGIRPPAASVSLNTAAETVHDD